MYEQQMQLSYRRTALSGASSIGLVIALCDTLSGNLRRAVAAIVRGDIGKRCAELNHAFLVVGQLESMIDKQPGDPLADSLATFYAYLRSKMLEASIQQSASVLEAQIDLVLQIRAAWQQRESATPQRLESASLIAETTSLATAGRSGFSQSV